MFTDRQQFEFHHNVKFHFRLDYPVARTENIFSEMEFQDDIMKKGAQITLVSITSQFEKETELQISLFQWFECSEIMWLMGIRDEIDLLRLMKELTHRGGFFDRRCCQRSSIFRGIIKEISATHIILFLPADC